MSIPVSIDPLGTLGGELPPGYKQMRYIASTVGGGQYINTGVVADATTIWMLDWAPMQTGYVSHGSFEGYGHVDIAYDSTLKKFRATRAALITSSASTYDIGTRLEVWLDVLNSRCKFGNDEWKELGKGTVFAPVPMTLFCRNREGERQYLCASQVYRSTIWKGAELVSELVPALDPDGRPCMYNLAGTGTVEQNTFYNSGSGEFLYQ